MKTAAEALEEVLALGKIAIEGPYYVAVDDAEDSPPHRNSGLALLETGRQSDWTVARLCEWPTAEYIVAMEDFIRTHAAALRAALAAPQAGEVEAWEFNDPDVQECDNGLGHIEITDGLPDWVKAIATEARRLLRATQSNGHSPDSGSASDGSRVAGADSRKVEPATSVKGYRGVGSGESPAQSSAAKVGVPHCDFEWPRESPAQSAPGREWPAKLRLTELLREAANALEACHAANEDLLSKRVGVAPTQEPVGEYIVSEAGVRGVAWNANVALPSARGPLYAAPPPPAPAQEPVAHGPVSERFMRHHYGASGYVNLAERLRKIASGEWALKGDEGYLRQAADLLAAPPPNEARELLDEAILYVRGDAESGYEDAVQLHERIRAYLARHK